MSPDENVREQEEIISKPIIGGQDIERLRELQAALSDWLRGGGFPPRVWKEGKP